MSRYRWKREGNSGLIAFGTCVGPSGRYEEFSLPSIRSIAEPDTQILAVHDSSSIFVAYNDLIRRARELPDLEALVLLHDDVIIQDVNFLARIRRILRDPAVGVIGVIGHRNLHSLRYWEGRPGYGKVWDGGGVQHHGPLRGDVDAVDGLLMVLSPRALSTVAFDEATYSGFLGYDADYCMSCRVAGHRVVVEPFRLFHISTGSAESSQFALANEQFVQKWGDQLAKTPIRYRNRAVGQAVAAVQIGGRRWRRRTAPLAEEVGHVAQQVSHRARRVTERGGGGTPLVDRANDQADGIRAGSRLAQRSGGFETARCVACGDRLSAAGIGAMLRCASCGTCSYLPGPSEGESHDSGQAISEYQRAHFDRRRQWVDEARARLGWVQSLVPEGLLLEIGSASGEFVELAARRGYEVFGIEPRDWLRTRRSSEDRFAGSFDQWVEEYRDFKVDAIVMFDGLLGLSAPASSLQLMAGALAPGGVVALEGVNAASRRAMEPAGDWWTTREPGNYFTSAGIRLLVEKAGLEVIECREISDRIYVDNARWDKVRARDRARGLVQPSGDLWRVAARKTV